LPAQDTPEAFLQVLLEILVAEDSARALVLMEHDGRADLRGSSRNRHAEFLAALAHQNSLHLRTTQNSLQRCSVGYSLSTRNCTYSVAFKADMISAKLYGVKYQA
jgi:hypothetical protein